MELFYKDITEKREAGKKRRMQTDRQFEQNKIKRLNKTYNMFSLKVQGSKAFAAEQKIREGKRHRQKT